MIRHTPKPYKVSGEMRGYLLQLAADARYKVLLELKDNLIAKWKAPTLVADTAHQTVVNTVKMEAKEEAIEEYFEALEKLMRE